MTHLPFQKPRTFLGVPTIQERPDAPIVVVGAPSDCATTFRSGSRMGPGAVRDASLMLTDGSHEMFINNPSDWVADAGNMALPTGYAEQAVANVEQCVTQLAKQGKHVITLGGDHLITLGVLRALYNTHGRRMALVHLDAHCDTWMDHAGFPLGHGTWLYHAIQDGIIVPEAAMSIGVRSPAEPAVRDWLHTQGGVSVSARKAMSVSPAKMAYEITTRLNAFSALPVYLSLDIDCLDPAHAPGTGTPEIGGLTSMWVSELIDLLCPINCCGMDLVEVAPSYDHSQITALAGATFVWQYVCQTIHKIDH